MNGHIFGDPITDHDSGTTYRPFIGANGQVGYECTDSAGECTYIYLNASGGSDDGVATIFVYQGEAGDPVFDCALVHYDVWAPYEQMVTDPHQDVPDFPANNPSANG